MTYSLVKIFCLGSYHSKSIIGKTINLSTSDSITLSNDPLLKTIFSIIIRSYFIIGKTMNLYSSGSISLSNLLSKPIFYGSNDTHN